MPSFSQYAIDKMKDLYNNHSHEVGIELKKNDPTYYASYNSTDCTTYVLNVLSYAYEKSGDNAFAKQIWTYGKDPSDRWEAIQRNCFG